MPNNWPADIADRIAAKAVLLTAGDDFRCSGYHVAMVNAAAGRSILLGRYNLLAVRLVGALGIARAPSLSSSRCGVFRQEQQRGRALFIVNSPPLQFPDRSEEDHD